MMQNPSISTSDREIVVTRVLNAPIEIVFRTWSDPKHISNWWGPKGFTTTTHCMDFKPGGVWRFVMHGPDGRDYQNRVNYLEIVPNERISYQHGGGEDTEHIHFHVNVTFADVDGKTKVTLQSIFASTQARDFVVQNYGAVEGAIQTIGRLADHLSKVTERKSESLTIALPSEKEIILSRTFHAPRRLVYEAHTKAEHLRKWWGPRCMSIAEIEMDFRVGGNWKIVSRGPDGKDYVFKGTYHEIVPPERLVCTECYDEPSLGSPQWQSTITFEEQDGKTTVKSVVVHPSVEARNGHLYSGMEVGASETFDRLEELVASMN